MSHITSFQSGGRKGSFACQLQLVVGERQLQSGQMCLSLAGQTTMVNCSENRVPPNSAPNEVTQEIQGIAGSNGEQMGFKVCRRGGSQRGGAGATPAHGGSAAVVRCSVGQGYGLGKEGLGEQRAHLFARRIVLMWVEKHKASCDVLRVMPHGVLRGESADCHGTSLWLDASWLRVSYGS